VIGIVFALPMFATFTALGWGLDRALAMRFDELGAARWPLRFFAGAAAASLFALHWSMWLLALAAPFAMRRSHSSSETSRASVFEMPDRVLFGAVAALALVALARPESPIYWDEFVWLWKSRIEQGGWGELHTIALDPRLGLFPRGYPLFWSSLVAWLAWPFERAPLTAAAALVTLSAAASWLGLVREATRTHEASARNAVLVAAGALLITPIALVHLRSAYVDLTVGLLAASIALALAPRDDASDRVVSFAAAIVLAIVVTGFKDEGFVHVIAVVIAAVLLTLPNRVRGAWRAALVLLAAAIPFVTWRWLLARAGITDVEHRLGTCAITSTAPLAFALARHAFRIESWGALWPFALGAAVASFVRRETRRGPAAALALTACLQLAVLLAGITCGPESTREFAFDGSLLNRALLQIAPTAIALIAVGMRQEG
jgi:hypothetical protein